MESGAYEQAIPLYEQLLREDPRNEEAIIGLKTAREKVIDTSLIQVRLSRIAENHQNALDILSHLVFLENSWKTYPAGRVAFTQDEETGYAFDFVTRLLRKAVLDGKPLLAQYTANKYQPIFTGNYAEKFSYQLHHVKEAGIGQCNHLSSHPDRSKPYYIQFVQKLCAVWGKPGPAVSVHDLKAKGLFQDVSGEAQIEGLPHGFEGKFFSGFQSALKQSPWFHPQGARGAIPIHLIGNYIKTKEKELINQVHEYWVSVPYTAYELVTKTRQVPYQGSELKCYSGNCSYYPVTQYRTESYQESEPVTRYRSEARSQRYEAWRHRQVLKIIIDGKARLGTPESGVPRPDGLGAPVAMEALLSVTDRLESQSIQHDWNMPDIGLRPSPLNLPDPTAWLNQQADKMTRQFDSRLSEIWDSLYCKEAATSSESHSEVQAGGASGVSKEFLAQSGDPLHRCLRSKKNNPPEFVNRWYLTYFGIGTKEANEILGLKDF